MRNIRVTSNKKWRAFLLEYFVDGMVKSVIKEVIVRFANVHRTGLKKDIFVFDQRRSGSTWIMQLLSSQPGIKYSAEPLYLPRWNFYKQKLPQRQDSKFMHLEISGEKILKRYFSGILNGKIQVSPPWNIFDKDYNFFTNRSVVKICNGLSLINWFEENFDIQIVYLVRHPISTALSIINQGWPDTAGAFLNNKFFTETYLNKRQLEFAKDIKRYGSRLQCLVIEWCLENLVPLRSLQKRSNDWIVVTYEELVMNPEKVIDILCEKLDLEDKNKIKKKIFQPSMSVDKLTHQHIESKNNEYLLKRWKDRVSEREERQVFKILKRFGIDAYNYGDFMPCSSLLHFPSHINKR